MFPFFRTRPLLSHRTSTLAATLALGGLPLFAVVSPAVAAPPSTTPAAASASSAEQWAALAASARGDLQAMLELVEAAPVVPQARITRPAGDLWQALRDAGRFDELGLTPAEGRTLVNAVYRRLGAPEALMGDTWPVRHQGDGVQVGHGGDPIAEPGVVHRVQDGGNGNGQGTDAIDFRGSQEFENIKATLFRWPYDWSALRDEYAVMLQAAFDGDSVAAVWVGSTQQQAQAESYLQSQNVPTSHIRWVVAPTNSVWIRDYGPLFLYEIGGNRYGLADFHYYSNRPADDDTPLEVADALNIPVMNRQTANVVYTEGGNLMHDGVGLVTYSTRTYSQNQGVPRTTIDQRILTAFDASKAIVPQDPTLDGTGHVDMFLKIVNEDTILVGQYAPNQRDYQILENAAALFAGETNGRGEPWNVVRIPQPDVYYVLFIFPVVRTYTNSVIFNDQVVVPTYGIAADAQALAIYEQVFPGRTIISLNANDIIEAAGAWHCVTMEHPDPMNVDP